MKAPNTIIAFLIAAALTAQSNDFRIRIARNSSVNTAMQVGTTVIRFDNTASHLTDIQDVVSAVTDSSLAYPFTTDSSASHIFSIDARPKLRTTLYVPLGIWDAQGGEIFIQGSWDDSDQFPLYTVSLVDNSTGTIYNAYNELNFSLSGRTNFSEQFTLVFTPTLNILSFNEACFGSVNGSMYVRSPQPNWEMKLYANSSLIGNYFISGIDTFIHTLAAGSYDFIYLLDGQTVDTVTAVITSPAPVISAASASALTVILNQSIIFTNTSSGAVEYAWDFGDGQTSTDVSPNYTYANTGQFSVTLVAFNLAGCSDTSTIAIEVNPELFPVHQTPSMNPRGNGAPDMSSQIRTISSEGQATLTVASNKEVESVVVYNMNGQGVYFGTSAKSQSFVYQTAGFYIATVTYVDGTIATERIILN